MKNREKKLNFEKLRIFFVLKNRELFFLENQGKKQNRSLKKKN